MHVNKAEPLVLNYSVNFNQDHRNTTYEGMSQLIILIHINISQPHDDNTLPKQGIE